jgi:hypothetical protein
MSTSKPPKRLSSRSRRGRALPYAEGTCFGVPLRTGGFGVGIAARLDGEGVVFGFFFAPMREKLPTLSDMQGILTPDDAILAGKFGDLYLIDGKWPVIGRYTPWVRDLWAPPPLIRVDDRDSGLAFLSVYSDDDLEFIREERCSPTLVGMYPQDRLMGAGAVEVRLTKLLSRP